MKPVSKGGTFLMEFIIMLLAFSLCGVVVLRLFAKTDSLRLAAVNTDTAITLAQSRADELKATGGDPTRVDALFDDNDGSLHRSFYDSDWLPCSEADAVFILSAELEPSVSADALTGTITVSGGEVLCELPFCRVFQEASP